MAAAKRVLLAGILAAALASPQDTPEVSSQDSAATFRARVNLVLVPVVVRDTKGNAVGGLKREDFQLFDQGKPQIITRFSMEKRGELKIAKPEEGQPAGEALPAGMPGRFTAYLFDDVHLAFGDLAQVRDAAARHLATTLEPSDRAAIYTTSGQTMLEFTDDREELQRTLLHLRPRPIASTGMQNCPDMDYYMADMISEHNDQAAIEALISETIACMHLAIREGVREEAKNFVVQVARRVREEGRTETHAALRALGEVIRRLSTMPGQRNLVLVSPGFLNLENQFDESELIDRAIRSNVTINTLNARGLYVTGLPDISKTTFDAVTPQLRRPYEMTSATMGDEVLAELADNTGGTFFHNNNDLREGFHKLAAMPDFTYVLGFSPQNLKIDGKYHKLKVMVREPRGLNLSSRRGYVAPRKVDDAAEQAREEIREALYSREELRELNAELHTQFFKIGDDKARLTALVRVDLRQLQFRKQDGRNCDNLTVIYGLFDRNGNYLQANQTTVSMRLLDDTLQNRLHAPITLRSSFEVAPGAYLIRMVVRDSEGQLMAARNGGVEIP